MKRIVFVCSGNICRSPMAAGLASKMLEDAGVPSVVISAGTLNIQGSPASEHAVDVVASIDVDISMHRSQGVSPHLMRLADQIVVMAPNHEEHILGLDRSLAPKIHRLWEYADPDAGLTEIADPVNQSRDVYEECRDLLVSCLERWVQRIKILG